jgi:TP901 family phage tail tape measure protein
VGFADTELGIYLKLNTVEFQNGIKAARSGMKGLAGASQGLGQSLDKHTGRAVRRLTAAFTGLMTASAVVGSRFDREVSFMGAIANATGSEVDQLSEKARELGRTTMFSATQAAQAMQNLARSGMDTNEIIAASGPALRLAGAAGTDMATATNLLASTLAQFNLDATDSSRITDVFATAITNSLLDITSLREAMKYAGTVGQAFGMSIEEATAAVAQFRNIGLEGSLAGTNFRMAMQAAAVTTEKKEAIMRKLGMTMADISPEFNTFGDILQKLGKTAMGSTDALEVFGRRAGANMAGLIKNARAGRDEYGELVAQLEQSVGETERLYEQATANILDQSIIVKSAFQDILLSIFVGYQEPLSNMLTTIAESFNTLSQDIGDSAGSARNVWTQTMEAIEVYFMVNSGEWAGKLQVLIEKLAQMIQLFVNMIPLLTNVAQVMLTVWAFNNVLSFAGAINTMVIPALGNMVARITAAGGAGAAVGRGFAWLKAGSLLARFTGFGLGLTAVYVGAKLAVKGVKALAGAATEASGDIEGARHTLAGFRAGEERTAKKADIAYKNAAQATAEWAEAQIKAISATRDLTNAERHQLETLTELNQERVRAGIKQGQYIIASADIIGTNRDQVRSQRQLAQAIAEGEKEGASAEDKLAGEQALAALREYSQSLTTTYNETHLGQYKQVNLALERLNNLGGINIGYWTKKLEAQYDSVEAAVVEQTMLRRVTEEYKEQLAAIERVSGLELRRARTTEEIAARAKAIEDERGRAEGAKKWASAWSRAIKKVDKMHQDIVERWEDSNTDAAGVAMLEWKRTVAELKKVYDEAIRLVGANSKRGMALAAQYASDVAMMQATVANDYLAKVEALEKEYDQDGRERGMVHEQDLALYRLKTARASALEEAEIAYGKAEGNAAAEKDIQETFLDHKRVLETKYRDDVYNANSDSWEKAASVRIGLEKNLLSEREQIERKYNDLITALHKDAVDAKKEYELAKSQELAQHQIELRKQVLGEMGRDTEVSITELVKKLSQVGDIVDVVLREQYRGMLSAQLESMKMLLWLEQNIPGVMGRLNDEQITSLLGILTTTKAVIGGIKKEWENVKPFLKRVWDALPEGMQNALGFVGEKIKTVALLLSSSLAEAVSVIGPAARVGFKIMTAGIKTTMLAVKVLTKSIAAISDVVGKVGDAWSKVTDIVANLTGLSIDMLGTAGEAQALMVGRAELEAKIASGELSGEELTTAQAALAGMPTSTEGAASGLIAAEFQQAVDSLFALVKSLPEMLKQLAAELPDFILALVGAIPDLIDAVVENIEPIVTALLDGAISITDALIEKLPDLVGKIVAMLPKIVKRLGEQLPTLITAIYELIIMIVKEVPTIIGAVVDALPDIITALNLGLADLIVAVFKAIPKIIKKLVKALPEINNALTEGLVNVIATIIMEMPAVVNGIIDALPRLIAALVMGIPILIVEIIKAIPMIIMELVKALPVLIWSLIALVPNLLGEIYLMLHEMWFDIFASIEAFWKDFSLKEWLAEQFKSIGDWWTAKLKQVKQYFKDFMEEFWSFGKAETKTFGDTPGVQEAGSEGGMAGFAPGDLFAAAQSPEGLLTQVAEAFGVGPGRAPEFDVSSLENMVRSLGSAQLSAAGAGGGGDLQVTVVAEGKTLDEVLYTAGKRGHTPSLKRDLRRASGATVGLDRGRFESQS